MVGGGEGGFGLDFKISYLDIISQRESLTQFGIYHRRLRLCFRRKSLDLAPQDAMGFVEFTAKAGLTGKQRAG
jgi:hypothetical protein